MSQPYSLEEKNEMFTNLFFTCLNYYFFTFEQIQHEFKYKFVAT